MPFHSQHDILLQNLVNKLYKKNTCQFFPIFLDCSFTEEVKNITKTMIRNCNDVYGNGYRTTEIYSIFTGEKFIEVFCELEREGNNWLVSKGYLSN